MEERRGTTTASVVWRWLALAAYVALLYGSLPFGPRLGMRFMRTALGGYILGPGLPLIALGGAGVLMVVLRRRRAPAWAFFLLAAAACSYAYAFSWLRSAHLERTHLPEYGLASLLAWRALAPFFARDVAAYVAAALLGVAIGYGDELIQSVTPGRHYDVRDVVMNAVGAVLGMVVLAAARARRPPPPAAPMPVARVTNEVTSRRALNS